MALLEAHQLAIGYTKAPIAQHISLSLAPRQIVTLLGANGCGKTTLLKTLLGLLPPLAGEILCDGKQLSAWQRHDLARFIGYVPQA